MSRVAQEASYRQLIDGLPQLIWSFKPGGECNFVNARWTEYTGKSAASLLERGWLECVHPDDRERVEDSWPAALAGQNPARVAMRLRSREGAYQDFEAQAIPLDDGHGPVRWIGATAGTAAGPAAESGALERRVRDRTAKLQAQSEKLRALARDLVESESRERKRLAQMLHDHFQQLVSAAKMKVGILRRRSADSAAVESLIQTESLLEEALSASRSLATELSPPVLHDGGLAPALQWLVRRMDQNNGLAIDLRIEDYKEPDDEQVRIIVFECVQELLFNVVKHSGVKSAELIASVSPEGLLRISVVDHGRGFDPLGAESGNEPDGRFGLFGIQERLSLIGGLAKVRSHPGQGTVVELSVPTTFDPQDFPMRDTQPARVAPSPNARRALRVLVADDHKLFREGLISLLGQEPYLDIVGECGDGQQAIDLARKLRPDILIVDVTMPRVNGVQVTAVLSREMPDLKIVGLSMHERDDMAVAMRKAGAIAYCAKNAPVEQLVNILRAACGDDSSLAPSHT